MMRYLVDNKSDNISNRDDMLNRNNMLGEIILIISDEMSSQ